MYKIYQRYKVSETKMVGTSDNIDLMTFILGAQHQSEMNAAPVIGSLNHDLEHLVQTIRQHLGMDVAFLSRFYDGNREMLYVDKRDMCNVSLNIGHKDKNEETYCQLIAEEKLPKIIPDTSKNEITKALAVTKVLNIGSYIGVPIYLSDDSLYGTLCCFSEQADESLTNKDLSILTLFAKFAARNIEKELVESKAQQVVKDSIFDIINNRQLSIVLQPIYDFRTRSVEGFECLSRFQTEPYRSPDYWFNKANASGFGEVLELFAIEEALNQLSNIPEQYYITLNVSPKHLISAYLQAILDEAPLHRIVLEVTEREPIPDYQVFRNAIQHFRDRGMRLAVDDAGAGFASFQHILELEADIIKLDRSLIANINSDHRKRALVAALIGFAKETKSTVLGEGVETLAELEVLQELGAQKIQGYFFCHPLPLKDVLAFCEA